MAIKSFGDRGTADVFNGYDSKAARRTCPRELLNVARRKLDQIQAVTRLSDLSVPPGNRLEALTTDRRGQHSIRINDQFRVCFTWTDAGCEDVAIVDYHS